MTTEVYEYVCDDCGRIIKLSNPAEPEWCPFCGVRL